MSKMTLSSRIRHSLLSKVAIGAALFLVAAGAWGASWTASVSGNWSNAATWGGGGSPVSGDDVTINTGITVTLDVSGLSIKSLTINGTGILNLVTNTLTMNGIGAVSGSGTIEGTAGTFVASALTTIAMGSLGVNGVTALGTYTPATTSTTLTGDWNVTAYTSGADTIVFAGAAAQNVTSSGNNFNAVSVTKTGGSLAFTDALVSTDLQAAAGGYSISFTAAASPSVTVTNASTLAMSGGLNFNGGTLTYSFNGGLTATASIATTAAGGTKTIESINQPISLGPLVLNSQTAIRSNPTYAAPGADITINGSVTGNNNNFYLYAMNHNALVTSNVTAIATLRPARNVAASTGTTTYQGTVAAIPVRVLLAR